MQRGGGLLDSVEPPSVTNRVMAMMRVPVMLRLMMSMM
jgi:hypothetical protein